MYSKTRPIIQVWKVNLRGEMSTTRTHDQRTTQSDPPDLFGAM